MRINRFLATCGVASRRASEKLIRAGRVTVNGRRVQELSLTVDESRDIVRVDGKQVNPQRRKVYFLFNKPRGIITTAQDELGRKTIFDVVKVRERVFPVGRLDRNSEGLLLLTNDGDLAHRLLHPSFEVRKTYRVKLDRPFDEPDFEKLAEGVELEDGTMATCRARFYADDPLRIEVQIHEGRKHIVRRLFTALGYDVKTLKRTQLGPLELKNMRRGQWRLLSPTELFQLRKAVGLIDSDDKKDTKSGDKQKN
jgi:pseudouridine synthase